jgi:heat shock protein HslJ
VKKSLLFGFIVLCGIGLVYYAINKAKISQSNSGVQNTPDWISTQVRLTTPTNIPTSLPTSLPTASPGLHDTGYLEIGYQINGETAILKNGVSEVPITPGSASMTVTRYFGHAVSGDLNGDMRDDVAFLLTQTTGGSGTFFYVVSALKMDAGYAGTNGILLGDRIAPQSTSIDNGEIVVSYADRRPDEPFTIAPSVGVSRRFKVVNENLIEVSSTQITSQEWVWSNTLMNDGTRISPNNIDAFSITFGVDGKVSGTTDCNSFTGNYTIDSNRISFGKFVSTLMACEGSQESVFLQSLMGVNSFSFDLSTHQLILQLAYDSGVMIFR